MGWKLCIAEKPSVAKDIARVIGATTRNNGYYEGNGYLVTWAVGHLVGLAEPEAYGFVPQKEMFEERREEAYNQLPLLPSSWKLIVLKPTKDQFNIIKELMHRPDVDSIIDCGDMGPEGHILQWLIREKAGCNKPVVRFCATSMTDEAIRKAMEDLQPITKYHGIIQGEFCKKRADWILGMSMSRCLTLKYGAGIDVGRVQSPTLYFVVQRWLEVQKFKPQSYYTMEATMQEGFKVFWAKDMGTQFPSQAKDSQGKILERSLLEQKAQEIQAEQVATVINITESQKATDRPQLYDITELQRDANRLYGYSAAATLATAQALYETHKVLSYPRTDSRYLTSDLEPYLPQRVEQISSLPVYYAASNKVLQEGLRLGKRIIDDSKVTDHHALIPTETIQGFDMERLEPTKDEAKKEVTTESLKNILHLVITRFLVAFSQPYQYERTELTVRFANNVEFSASGNRPTEQGWKSIQSILMGKQNDDGKEKESEQVFPPLQRGQQLHIRQVEVVEKQTSSPKLHTEATLLTAMEHAGSKLQNGAALKGKGIGTQATRSEIIKKLFDKGYVESRSGKGKASYIVPTPKGVNVMRVIPMELLHPQITADWEQQIADITAGKLSETRFMEEFTTFIRAKVQEAKTADISGVNFDRVRETFGECPWCGGQVHKAPRKEGEKIIGYGFYCSNKCGFSIDTNNSTVGARTGKKLTEAQIKKFIKNGSITLDCVSGKTGKKYQGLFRFEKKISGNGNPYTTITMSFPDKQKKK